MSNRTDEEFSLFGRRSRSGSDRSRTSLTAGPSNDQPFETELASIVVATANIGSTTTTPTRRASSPDDALFHEREVVRPPIPPELRSRPSRIDTTGMTISFSELRNTTIPQSSITTTPVRPLSTGSVFRTSGTVSEKLERKIPIATISGIAKSAAQAAQVWRPKASAVDTTTTKALVASVDVSEESDSSSTSDGGTKVKGKARTKTTSLTKAVSRKKEKGKGSKRLSKEIEALGISSFTYMATHDFIPLTFDELTFKGHESRLLTDRDYSVWYQYALKCLTSGQLIGMLHALMLGKFVDQDIINGIRDYLDDQTDEAREYLGFNFCVLVSDFLQKKINLVGSVIMHSNLESIKQIKLGPQVDISSLAVKLTVPLPTLRSEDYSLFVNTACVPYLRYALYVFDMQRNRTFDKSLIGGATPYSIINEQAKSTALSFSSSSTDMFDDVAKSWRTLETNRPLGMSTAMKALCTARYEKGKALDHSDLVFIFSKL